ncbi:MAG: hypothetical protein ACR2NP_12500, partial [Pirellulaceae bacterium]
SLRKLRPEESLQILEYARSSWTFPIAQNHRDRDCAGHLRRCDYVEAVIHDRAGLPRIALAKWMAAYWDWSPWSCWLAVRANEMTAAKRGFWALTQSDDSARQNRGWYGYAFLALVKGNGPKALEFIANTDDEITRRAVVTVEAWASAIEDPASIDQLNVFDLTGIYGVDFIEGRRGGLWIDGLLPGSPLLTATTPLFGKDIVMAINGIPLNSEDNLQQLRQQSPNNSTITLTVRRRDRVFETTFNVEQARTGIRNALQLER